MPLVITYPWRYWDTHHHLEKEMLVLNQMFHLCMYSHVYKLCTDVAMKRTLMAHGIVVNKLSKQGTPFHQLCGGNIILY